MLTQTRIPNGKIRNLFSYHVIDSICVTFWYRNKQIYKSYYWLTRRHIYRVVILCKSHRPFQSTLSNIHPFIFRWKPSNQFCISIDLNWYFCFVLLLMASLSIFQFSRRIQFDAYQLIHKHVQFLMGYYVASAFKFLKLNWYYLWCHLSVSRPFFCGFPLHTTFRSAGRSMLFVSEYF